MISISYLQIEAVVVYSPGHVISACLFQAQLQLQLELLLSS